MRSCAMQVPIDVVPLSPSPCSTHHPTCNYNTVQLLRSYSVTRPPKSRFGSNRRRRLFNGQPCYGRATRCGGCWGPHEAREGGGRIGQDRHLGVWRATNVVEGIQFVRVVQYSNSCTATTTPGNHGIDNSVFSPLPPVTLFKALPRAKGYEQPSTRDGMRDKGG